MIRHTDTGIVTDGRIIAVSPGATIQEQLDRLNMSVEEFSQNMQITQDDTKDLLDGVLRITPDIAERLEQVIDIPAKYWQNLDNQYMNKLRAMFERIEASNDDY